MFRCSTLAVVITIWGYALCASLPALALSSPDYSIYHTEYAATEGQRSEASYEGVGHLASQSLWLSEPLIQERPDL